MSKETFFTDRQYKQKGISFKKLAKTQQLIGHPVTPGKNSHTFKFKISRCSASPPTFRTDSVVTSSCIVLVAQPTKI